MTIEKWTDLLQLLAEFLSICLVFMIRLSRSLPFVHYHVSAPVLRPSMLRRVELTQSHRLRHEADLLY